MKPTIRATVDSGTRRRKQPARFALSITRKGLVIQGDVIRWEVVCLVTAVAAALAYVVTC